MTNVPPPEISDEQLTVSKERLDWISRISSHAASQAVKRYSRRALAGFIILGLAFGYNVYYTNHKSYQARGVLCRIIKTGDRSLYQYQREGTISKPQLNRALEQSANARRDLQPAENCDADITGPAKANTPVSPSK